MTVLQFGELILKITGSSSEIIFEPLPVDDPKQRRPDISLTRKMLGWGPAMEAEKGLGQTIDYFRGRVK